MGIDLVNRITGIIATLAGVEAVTDAIPDAGAMTDIGTDTARLTAVRAAVLTDWIDGGRLDLLLDTVISVIGALDDAGSLAADTSTLVALAREAAKESWEIEKHFHNGQLGFGVATAPAGETHIADRVGIGAAGAEAGPLVLDAGNDDWGAWTQLMGSSDTPPSEIPTATHYDVRFIKVVATEDDEQRYMMQVAVQEDAPADDPTSSDYFSEMEFFIQAAAVQGSPVLPIIELPIYRRPTATKMWGRLRAPNLDTSTASFYMYGHFYIDPDV